MADQTSNIIVGVTNDTEAGIKAILQNLDRFNKAQDQLNRKTKESSDVVSNLISRAKGMVSVGAIEEFARRSYLAYTEADRGMTRIQISSGMTKEAMRLLGDEVGRLSQKFKFDPKDIREGFIEMQHSSGWATADIIRNYEKIVQGARAANVTPREFAEAISASMRGFRVSADETDKVIESFVTGAKGHLLEILPSIARVSTQMGQFPGSGGMNGLRQMIAYMTNLTEATGDSHTAAMLLQNIYGGNNKMVQYVMRTKDAQKDLLIALAEELDARGMLIKDTDNQFEAEMKRERAAPYFNMRQITALRAILNERNRIYDSLIKMGVSEGEAARMSNKYLNDAKGGLEGVTSGWSRVKEAAGNFLDAIGSNAVANQIANFFQIMTDGALGAARAIRDLKTLIDGFKPPSWLQYMLPSYATMRNVLIGAPPPKAMNPELAKEAGKVEGQQSTESKQKDQIEEQKKTNTVLNWIYQLFNKRERVAAGADEGGAPGSTGGGAANWWRRAKERLFGGGGGPGVAGGPTVGGGVGGAEPFSQPAGTPVIPPSERATVTLSNGVTYEVNKDIAEQSKAYNEYLIAHGAPITRVGGVGARANQSAHPSGHAWDTNQQSRNVIDKKLADWEAQNQDVMNEAQILFETIGGEHFVHGGPDRGHQSIKRIMSPEELKQAKLEGQKKLEARRAAGSQVAQRTITGGASYYEPGRGRDSGGRQTASGELYDPTDWTAAIQTQLEPQFFGGQKMGYGENYRPGYAIVEYGGKKVRVRINDRGPLYAGEGSGRVVDLNRRTMQYFDPDMRQGVLQGAKITPSGPGPLGPIDERNIAADHSIISRAKAEEQIPRLPPQRRSTNVDQGPMSPKGKRDDERRAAMQQRAAREDAERHPQLSKDAGLYDIDQMKELEDWREEMKKPINMKILPPPHMEPQFTHASMARRMNADIRDARYKKSYYDYGAA